MWSSGSTDSIAGVLTRNHAAVSGVFPVVLLLLSAAEQAAGQSDQPDRTNDPYDYGRISPAMAVIVVVLIAALFFMGFFSIYIRHCTRSRDAASVRAAGRSRRVTNAAARGLDASVIETFPTFVYSEVKTLMIGKGALECAVCLNEFEDDETLRLLPKCDHVFHPNCIGAWLEGHVTCPVCRTNLAEQPVEADLVQPVEPERTEADLEAQRHEVPEPVADPAAPEPPRAEELGGAPPHHPRVKFSRSHTTGHSLVQPGENTERFTLRLPDEVRKRIMANWKLNRSNSLVVLPRGGSSRRGKQVDRLRVRSDRWLFRKTPSFLWRNSREEGSIKLGGTGRTDSMHGSPSDSVNRWAFLRNPSFLWRNSSVHSPRGANKDGEGSSVQPIGTGGSNRGSVCLPV